MAIVKDVAKSAEEDANTRRRDVETWSHIISVSGRDSIEAIKLREDFFTYFPAYKIVIISNALPNIDLARETKQSVLRKSKIMEMKNRFIPLSNFSPDMLKEEDIEATIIAAIYALRLTYQNGIFKVCTILSIF